MAPMWFLISMRKVYDRQISLGNDYMLVERRSRALPLRHGVLWIFSQAIWFLA